jgi:hypothetical protein
MRRRVLLRWANSGHGEERACVITLTKIKRILSDEEWQWTKNIIAHHGKQWVLDNWPMLKHQLDYVRSL